MPSSPLAAPDRILSALFILSERLGEDEPAKKRVAAMAKVSKSSLPAILSRDLKKKGWIEYGSAKDTIKLTKQGKERAATFPESDGQGMATTNKQVQDEIKSKLKGKALTIFIYLLDGKEHEKSDVMKAVDCLKTNSFNPIVSRDLKRHGYVEYPTRTTIKLGKACFPFPE